MTPAELAALHAAAFSWPRPWSENEFGAFLASPHVFLVTQRSAFALGRAIAGEAELLTIATHPDHRRAGLGQRCLAAFDEAARRRAADVAFLEVAATNAPAMALYKANGWVIAGQRRGYYQGPDNARIDAQILSKRLT